MYLHQFDYLFAIGTIFAFLDAWNIGANDVANSFATSVSSRSLTYIQAMCIGSVMEFTGSIAVGARVSDTIRTKIVDVTLFEDNPALLMLGMVCAVCASSLYLTFATRFGMPVSTTHSIMGGILGMGIAAVGTDGIQWWGGNINSGVTQVFLGWVIAPVLAGAFGAVIFLITKYGVMLRKNPVMKAFVTVPIYFGVTSALLTMLIVWKGGSAKIKISDAETVGVIIGVGAGVALLVTIFFLPWLYCVLIRNDWQLRWWHIPLGPLLLRRGEVLPPPAGHNAVRDYYRGHLTMEQLQAKRAAQKTKSENNEHNGAASHEKGFNTPDDMIHSDSEGAATPVMAEAQTYSIIGPRPEGGKFHPAVLFWHFKRVFFHGVEQDVISMQKKNGILTGDIEAIHARATHYDNRAEYMYSFLQAMTAATASFTHGANDVSNAIGPYTTIYYIWSTNQLKSKTPVPYWILAFGGAAIVIGLWTYGYNIMRNLGNRITLHSPSRGFSMELGSAITVIVATRLKLPVSTTQCISGATVGVGLCAGTWRTINWRMVAWIYMGWIITLPVTGIISGCIMGIIINAPRWGIAL
ncbi:phosphate-repressible phosphate permease [Capronia epimyces CBS 606.96]|uniref:Phosphate transporter n=1 Tax=Capronia epimyces CBS 606.96 TaxID=1182542 RepID=W9XRV4_9EURO|nr:phosphate-repressible phosphate permease [Capronia epimyces CBS 606.96]EXJ80065.1 phosphate-repressible phosphate permease [Capronia epimyces CBS 606.96]